MPTEKIADKKLGDLGALCLHREHRPPMHQVFSPGTYKHTCPGCGNAIYFTVNAIVC